MFAITPDKRIALGDGRNRALPKQLPARGVGSGHGHFMSFADYQPGRIHRDALAAHLDPSELAQCGRIYARGRTQRWIPTFYANDKQLRAVLVQAVIGYAFGGGRIPSEVATDIETLTRLALDRQADKESGEKAWNVSMQHLAACRDAGSYLAMIAAVSYRAWRLRWHAPTIAQEMGLSQRGVHRILQTLVCYAERLGFPTYKPRWVESRQPKMPKRKAQCTHGPDALRQGKKGPYCLECRREYSAAYYDRRRAKAAGLTLP